MGRKNTYGGVKMDYKKKIIEILDKIDNIKLLKRIYELAEYLYIYKAK